MARTQSEFEPLKRALGIQIFKLRERLGVPEAPLSAARLAARLSERLGLKTPLSDSTVLRWEEGSGHIEPWVLIELARMARTSVEVFVYPPPPDATLAPEAEPEETFLPPKAK